MPDHRLELPALSIMMPTDQKSMSSRSITTPYMTLSSQS
jgi:hypothetical protein